VELTGTDDESHEWILTHLLELVPDPGHQDVPRFWNLKAEIAIAGWSWLTEEVLN
jgi:hypothetical protein